MSTYDFNEMVNEAYSLLEPFNSNDLLILPDIVLEIGTTRLHWKNVKAYLQVIRRHPDFFMDFLKHELPGKEINWFSGSKADGLIIHGKKQKKIEIMELAKKFVNTCVVCSTCKKPNTEMEKMTSKYYEINCIDCGAKKTISY
jgi:translation initiation factor 2 beta subunit (eIF-2beta)/eIF-5